MPTDVKSLREKAVAATPLLAALGTISLSVVSVATVTTDNIVIAPAQPVAVEVCDNTGCWIMWEF